MIKKRRKRLKPEKKSDVAIIFGYIFFKSMIKILDEDYIFPDYVNEHLKLKIGGK